MIFIPKHIHFSWSGRYDEPVNLNHTQLEGTFEHEGLLTQTVDITFSDDERLVLQKALEEVIPKAVARWKRELKEIL